MVAALIAALFTVIIAIAALLVFFRMRARGSSKHASRPAPVSSIGGSSSPFVVKGGNAAKTQHQASGVSLQERLKSRFLAIGVLAAAIFGSLAAKLWSMQVLSSDQYLQEAQENLLTTIKTPAARGRIFDAEGFQLVGNETVPTILADVGVSEDRAVMQRLSALLGVPYNVVRARIKDTSGGAQALREVADGVPMRSIAFISEHPEAFPGVTVQDRTHRIYPYGALASQVLGYTGTASSDDLDNVPDGLDYQSGDEVGKSGIEHAYEKVLFGAHGERVVVADVDGLVREVRSETDPTQGNDVHLTLSARVQKVAEDALAAMIAPDGAIGTGKGVAGACVAMEVDTGDIVAMANFPTFTPESFVGGISQEAWDRFNAESSHYPLMNRCIAGTYPAASTFKAFTGLAGLHYGFADSTRTWDCSGEWTGFGEEYPQHCWDLDGHGEITFRTGVVVSCDIVFYNIAKDFYDARDSIGIDAMQDYIRNFGLGRKTGIELSGEAEGVIPTPEWKAEAFKDAPENAQWLPGDMSNMVIGQGDVLVTPIQIAVGYAGVATGKLPTPNLLKQVCNSAGDVVVTHTPSSSAVPEVTEEQLSVMRDALHGVSEGDSTVHSIISEYGYECGCKTGTGEAFSRADNYAWFVLYAPYDDPKYVVSCLIEEGGGGAQAAAPVAAEVMDACLKYGEGALDTDVTATVPILDYVERQTDSSNSSGRQD